MKLTYVCEVYESKLVTRDAWAEWNESGQEWVLGAAFDDAYCHDCEKETNLIERTIEMELEQQQ